jgi:hypothetical protein
MILFLDVCIICNRMSGQDSTFVIIKVLIYSLPRIIHSLLGWILCWLLNNPHYDVPFTWSSTLYHGVDIISLFLMKYQAQDDRYVIVKLFIYLLPLMDWLHYNDCNFETKLEFMLTFWYSTLLHFNDSIFNIVWWNEDFITASWMLH